jgi:hypothetical protein
LADIFLKEHPSQPEGFMDIVSVVLGIIIALVAVEAVAISVILLKMKSVKRVEEDVLGVIETDVGQLDRTINDRNADLDRRVGELYKELDRKVGEIYKDFKGGIEILGKAFETNLDNEKRDRSKADEEFYIASKGYTDSRFDKSLLGGKK